MKAIHVAIQQPALPKYRIPVFRELSSVDGLRSEIVFGDLPALDNAEPTGFRAIYRSTCRPFRFAPRVRIEPAHLYLVTDPRVDVALFCADLYSLLLLPSVAFAKIGGPAVVLWGHWASKRETQLKRFARRILARFGDALICYDHQAADKMIADGVSARRIFVAQNTLDLAEISRAQAMHERKTHHVELLRHSLDLTAENTLLFVSRLVAKKRVDLLLSTVARLVQDRPKLKLLILGDGPERRSLEGMAKSLHIDRHVHFAGAVYGEERLAAYFSAADVLCHPDGLGLSALHALAYGVPIVTSGSMSGHGPEARLLSHNDNALLVDALTPDAFADAVVRLLTDSALRKRLGDCGKTRVYQNCGIDRMVSQIVAAIEYAHHARNTDGTAVKPGKNCF
jgi:glycosyltransferase involved in cell wall biosynthesis